ncbi:MAG TPA: 50S ribosomal protein L13 [Candidatus Woesebacteria bacterium]|nr:50S ribosomal protein L13 [Candidatus Shapirobacteria bacterium]HOR01831.1 50S ribosomal protein L13 [Candidatus Woesebacteria bacterium]
MKTTVLKGNQVHRNWHLIDVSEQTLGRVCTQIAAILMGKDKPTFSYHRDDGDYVVAINAGQIKTTGSKLRDKIYRRHSHWPGGLKELTLDEMLKKDPRLVIKSGVYGMLPKNKLRNRRMTRLKIFVDSNHPYADKLTKK